MLLIGYCAAYLIECWLLGENVQSLKYIKGKDSLINHNTLRFKLIDLCKQIDKRQDSATIFFRAVNRLINDCQRNGFYCITYIYV